MKRILTLLLCCLLLTACSQKQPVPTEAPTEPPMTTEPTEAPTAAPTEVSTDDPTEMEIDQQLQGFTLYYGDDNAEFFLSEEVQVDEVNEDVVVQHLISAGVLTEDTAVNSLSKNGTQLVVDFNQAFADLVCSMGTSGERIIVGSTVNTFLSAFHAESMIFTVNGEILESGHVVYDFPLEFME